MPWFNARVVDPATGGTNFPVGRHPVMIESGERRGVKDKPNSGMLVFHLVVLDGPAKGMKGEYRLNIWNESTQAAEIAAKQLSAICHVVGVYDLESPVAAELNGKPFIIIVEPQADPKYTQITAVQDIQGNAPKKVDAAAQQGPSGGNPPWQGQAAQPAGQPAWSGAAPSIGNGAAPPWQGGGTAAPASPAAAAQPAWAQAPNGGGGKPPWAI